MNKNEYQQALQEAVRHVKFNEKLENDAAIADKMGYTRGTFSAYLSGTSKVSESFIRKFQDVFKLNLNDFSVSHGNMAADIDVPYLTQRRDQKNESVEFRVPLVTVKARAGYLNSYDSVDLINTLDKYAIPPGVTYTGAIWRYFEVDGDSMEPAMQSGDYVLCSQVPHEDWDNIKNYYVHVLVTETDIMIKRLFVKDTGEWVLISDNEQHSPQKLFDPKQLKELWVFRRLIKKTISAKKEFKIKI